MTKRAYKNKSWFKKRLYCSLQRKSQLCIPRKGIARSFHIHASVSDLYIPRIGPRLFFCSRPIVGIYKSLTGSHECGNWDCARPIPFLWIFVSNFRYCLFAVFPCCTHVMTVFIAFVYLLINVLCVTSTPWYQGQCGVAWPRRCQLWSWLERCGSAYSSAETLSPGTASQTSTGLKLL